MNLLATLGQVRLEPGEMLRVDPVRLFQGTSDASAASELPLLLDAAVAHLLPAKPGCLAV